LDFELATGYAVWDEVLVGKLPLRVDILLIRREAGQLSEASRRDLSVLVQLLNRFTLIEFKGPTDTLEPGDLAQLAGCAFLWHSQQAERVPQADISLIVLAPSVNEAVRDELRCLGWQIREHEAGVHRITGGQGDAPAAGRQEVVLPHQQHPRQPGGEGVGGHDHQIDEVRSLQRPLLVGRQAGEQLLVQVRAQFELALLVEEEFERRVRLPTAILQQNPQGLLQQTVFALDPQRAVRIQLQVVQPARLRHCADAPRRPAPVLMPLDLDDDLETLVGHEDFLAGMSFFSRPV